MKTYRITYEWLAVAWAVNETCPVGCVVYLEAHNEREARRMWREEVTPNAEDYVKEGLDYGYTDKWWPISNFTITELDY